jgi:predicted acetyltransferase
MPISIRDVRNSKKDRQWIESHYGEYIDSLADLNTGLFSVIGGDANPHEEEIFANWFVSDLSHPLVIQKGVQPVGFALVTRSRVPATIPGGQRYRMSEFFILQTHRRIGIGRRAATLIFDRFAGDWEIVEYQRHPGSIAFWRRVLSGYCPGRFTERSHNGEIQQHFKSRTAPPPPA